ncbi:MAG: hypothetical protein JNM00_06000 [Flavobacteriales bacterium]|nr:hypothetical protein [Flavobacteriales bacterium]
MQEFPIKYQASLFLDDAEIVPKARVQGELINLFIERDLISSITLEVKADGSTEPRLELSSQESDWKYQFLNQRFNITKTPRSLDPNAMGSLSEFLNRCREDFLKYLDFRKVAAYRLAINTEVVISQLTEINDVYQRVFKAIPYYSVGEVTEWTFRSVTRISMPILNMAEELNLITNLQRVTGRMNIGTEELNFNGLLRQFDLNTYQENTQQRFGVKETDFFFVNIENTYNELSRQIHEHYLVN